MDVIFIWETNVGAAGVRGYPDRFSRSDSRRDTCRISFGEHSFRGCGLADIHVIEWFVTAGKHICFGTG